MNNPFALPVPKKVKRGKEKLLGSKQRPAWESALAAGLLILALLLPFLPHPEWKFWNTEYIAFLVAMLAVPVLLLRHESKGSRWLRRVVLVVSLALFGFLQWACPRPTGALELLVVDLLKERPVLNFALKLGVLFTVTLLFGRFYCGWICPKGAIQEFLFQPELAWKVPDRLDRVLKYGKYVSLLALLVAAAGWQFRLFRELGPFKVLFNLDGTTFLVVLLGAVLLASVFIERPWCRYACPAGGLLGLVALFSPKKVRVAEDACIGCSLCARACPVGAITAPPGTVPAVAQQECLACQACEAACPRSCITLSTVPVLLAPAPKKKA